MTQDNKPTESKEENKKPQDNTGVMMTGHIKIFDPETGEVIVDKRNAIHYENMSQALANSLANKSTGFVHEMAFGNGGTSVDPTGIPAYSSASNQIITEYGKQNMFATQVQTQLVENYSSYPEEAEKTNGRWAMIGMIALLGAYITTGQIIPGIF